MVLIMCYKHFSTTSRGGIFAISCVYIFAIYQTNTVGRTTVNYLSYSTRMIKWNWLMLSQRSFQIGIMIADAWWITGPWITAGWRPAKIKKWTTMDDPQMLWLSQFQWAWKVPPSQPPPEHGSFSGATSQDWNRIGQDMTGPAACCPFLKPKFIPSRDCLMLCSTASSCIMSKLLRLSQIQLACKQLPFSWVRDRQVEVRTKGPRQKRTWNKQSSTCTPTQALDGLF